MEGHKNRYDPRFYLIKINSLILYENPKHDLTLQFRLGTKKSQSKYEVEDMIESDKGIKLTEEEALR